MFMKRKLKSDRGFTLAELLIVVAIIGVLVAIAIPIFTSQLERSREAVDLSDVRSAYAEVMMAAITGDTSATYTKTDQKIYQDNGDYYIKVTPLKQLKNDWQTPLPITIGGVSSNAGETYWKGIPGPNGYCEITYHAPTSDAMEYVSFYWESGNNASNKNENNTDKGDSNNSDTEDSSANTIIKDLNIGAIQYPNQPPNKEGVTEPFSINMGLAYKKNGLLYIAITNASYTNYHDYAAPDNNIGQAYFVQPTGTILTKDNLKDIWNNKELRLEKLKAGDIYKEGEDYYICRTDCSYYFPPRSDNIDTVANDSGNWIKINLNGSTNYN